MPDKGGIRYALPPYALAATGMDFAAVYMGPWAFFRASRRRFTKLRELSQILGEPSMSVAALISDAKEEAEEELYDLVEQDVTLCRVIHKFSATRDDLRHVYRMLLAAGAGQWVRGHYVAASALCYGFTLEFALTKALEEKSAAKIPKEIWLPAAFKLLDYFQNGKLARV